MKKIILKFFIIIFIFFYFMPYFAFALEELSDNEMETVVGQSGVDITLPGIDFTIEFDSFAIEDIDSGGYLIASNFNTGQTLSARFAQYILGSKGSIAMGNGYYKDIDSYIDAEIQNNNYNPPSFLPLTLDVIKDSSIPGSVNKYLRLGLPSMQLVASNLSDLSLRSSGNFSDRSAKPLVTLSIPSMVFEGHGGSLNLYPHANGGFDLDVDQAKFYWYNQKLIIGDSNWDGSSSSHCAEFNHFLVHKGGKNPDGTKKADFYHPFEYNGKINFDISTYTTNYVERDGTTDSESKTWLKVDIPENNSNIYVTLGQMNIDGTTFGSWEVGQFHFGEDFRLWISGHNNGMDAYLKLKLDSDELKYTYGTGANDYNNAINLHVANSFNPTDHSEDVTNDPNHPYYHACDWKIGGWQFNGTLNLGGPVTIKDWDSFVNDGDDTPPAPVNINIDQPLRIDMQSDRIVATTTIDGSIGIENVQLGGTNFGPVLATGIKGWARITIYQQ